MYVFVNSTRIICYGGGRMLKTKELTTLDAFQTTNINSFWTIRINGFRLSLT